MNFGPAIKTCLNKYATFSGRATRSEYWYFFLFLVIVNIVASILDSTIFGDMPVLYLITTLALLVPSIAAGVRRLHDTDRAGWWLLVGLIPVIGTIVLIVFFCQRGSVGTNQFGPDPLQASITSAHMARV
ncbi:DUF805 domain-containing protein [Microvirga sp. 3-52]|uniref:DUF805 domain-containing protein n=1 Tax=Microvirga sp. 3-52 TaxID=2792425 RepID=UPI001AD57775|nr:DUF805 domain-containing protein [Microvirga sp. 3-52]MBO1906417.1 DUF805 domain-containing protein [Microvirga sp. 3-52]MBS7453613.1 DUF805 domain-containing protein [Microvirga sp. 3-52]